MLKFLKKVLLLWALLCLPSLCGVRLIATTALWDWARVSDGHIRHLHQAYFQDGTYVLVYETFSGPPMERWAKLKRPLPHRESAEPQYEIHTGSPTAADLEGAVELPLINLREYLPDGKGDSIRGFVTERREQQGLQEVYFYESGGTMGLKQLHFYLPVASVHAGHMDLFGNHPMKTTIPLDRGAVMVLVWPFAVLGDLVLLPVVIFSPRW